MASIIGSRKNKRRISDIKATRQRYTPYRTEDRTKTLAKLGFASYRDYLRSDLWKLVRDGKLEETPHCELCGCKAQCVHHMDYKQCTLQGRSPWKLVCLCHACHRNIEFRSDGSKRNHEAVYKRLKKLLRKVGRWEIHTFRAKPKKERRLPTEIPQDW